MDYLTFTFLMTLILPLQIMGIIVICFARDKIDQHVGKPLGPALSVKFLRDAAPKKYHQSIDIIDSYLSMGVRPPLSTMMDLILT